MFNYFKMKSSSIIVNNNNNNKYLFIHFNKYLDWLIATLLSNMTETISFEIELMVEVRLIMQDRDKYEDMF